MLSQIRKQVVLHVNDKKRDISQCFSFTVEIKFIHSFILQRLKIVQKGLIFIVVDERAKRARRLLSTLDEIITTS